MFDPHAVAGGRPPGRVSVWFVAGVAACSLCALVSLAVVAAAGTASAAIGLTLALVPIPLLLAGVLYLDRLEPEPPSRLVFVFLWGAGAAALIGLIGSATGTHLITTPPLRPGGFAPAGTGATFGAPLVAETLKGAVLVGLLRWRRHELDGAHDGVVYAAMAGLGFALIENIYYYAQATGYGFGSLASEFVHRGALTPLCQTLFTSMVGIAVAYAAASRGNRGMWAIGAGWAAAVGLHLLWDDALVAGGQRLIVAYAILTAVLAAVLATVVADRRRIVALILRYLPAYGDAGVCTELDARMLASLRDRRQARQWARLHGGLTGLRHVSVYQLAATELGLLHRRAERDLLDSDTFAQRRDALLAGMQTATAGFLGRLRYSPQPPWAPHGPSAFGPPPKSAQPSGAPDAGHHDP